MRGFLVAWIVVASLYAGSVARADTVGKMCRDAMDDADPVVVPRDIAIEKAGADHVTVSICLTSKRSKLSYLGVYLSLFGADQRMLIGNGTTVGVSFSTIGRSNVQPQIMVPTVFGIDVPRDLPAQGDALIRTFWQECNAGDAAHNCTPAGPEFSSTFIIKTSTQNAPRPVKICD